MRGEDVTGTPLDYEGIRARLLRILEGVPIEVADLNVLLDVDVPALLAECETLRTALQTMLDRCPQCLGTGQSQVGEPTGRPLSWHAVLIDCPRCKDPRRALGSAS